MSKSHTKLIFAQVKNFDPNRPDLQEFLNKLAAGVLEEEAAAGAPRNRSRRKIRPLRRRARRN